LATSINGGFQLVSPAVVEVIEIDKDGILNKQQLAAKIWESAHQMRSKIEANEYKDYILGFIFYKYLPEGLWLRIFSKRSSVWRGCWMS
jgi:hypothetical protein